MGSEFAIAEINFMKPPQSDFGKQLIGYANELKAEGERLRMVKSNK